MKTYGEDELSAIWELVDVELQKHFSDTTRHLWFGDLSLVYIDDSRAILMGNSEFKRNIIEKRYLGVIEDAFEAVLGFRVSVSLRLSSEQNSVNSGNTGVAAPATYDADNRVNIDSSINLDGSKNTERSIIPDSVNVIINKDRSGISASGNIKLDPHSTDPFSYEREPDDFMYRSEYTFENFVVGNSNKFAHAACTAVANNPGAAYNPLFIYGQSGLGKTHLMYAVTNRIQKRNPRINIIYIKGEDFTNQLIEAIAKKSTSAFRDRYRNADVLLIDDVQFIAGKESTQEEFFHTFNALYENQKQIILTSDRPPKDIKTLEERLRTRFEWGLLADIQPPDMELRAAIIKQKIENLGVEVPNEVVTILSEKLKGSIRQIEGAIKRLGALSFLSGEPITAELAARSLSDIISGDVPLRSKIDRVIEVVSTKYGVSKEDLLGKKRTKEVAMARHIAIYLLRKKTDMSLPAIGAEFGRDHTTILSSCGVIEREITENPAFAAEINDLFNKINF